MNNDLIKRYELIKKYKREIYNDDTMKEICEAIKSFLSKTRKFELKTISVKEKAVNFILTNKCAISEKYLYNFKEDVNNVIDDVLENHKDFNLLIKEGIVNDVLSTKIIYYKELAKQFYFTYNL